MPLLKTPLIRPLLLILKLFNTPGAEPSWLATVNDAVLEARPETWEKSRLNCSGFEG